MKNLKDLLESHLNDNLSTPEAEQLTQTFDDAADFQRFRATFGRRITQQKQQRRLKTTLYAVGIVLIGLAAAWGLQKQHKKVYEKPPMRTDVAVAESPMSADDNFDKAYHQTLSNVRKDVKVDDVAWTTAYNAGRFAEAAQRIERIGPKASPEATYTLALCWIQQKQYDKAVAPLKRLIDNDPQQLKTFTPEARWLLANVYIKRHKEAEARILLQQFIDDNAPHADEAKALLKSNTDIEK